MRCAFLLSDNFYYSLNCFLYWATIGVGRLKLLGVGCKSVCVWGGVELRCKLCVCWGREGGGQTFS